MSEPRFLSSDELLVHACNVALELEPDQRAVLADRIAESLGRPTEIDVQAAIDQALFGTTENYPKASFAKLTPREKELLALCIELAPYVRRGVAAPCEILEKQSRLNEAEEAFVLGYFVRMTQVERGPELPAAVPPPVKVETAPEPTASDDAHEKHFILQVIWACVAFLGLLVTAGAVYPYLWGRS